MEIQIPENCNPFTKEKFEAITTYDQYEGAITDLNQSFHESYNNMIHHTFEKLGKENTPVIIMAHEEVMLFHRGAPATCREICMGWISDRALQWNLASCQVSVLKIPKRKV